MKFGKIFILYGLVLGACDAPNINTNLGLPKVMSTNACTDQLLLYLGNPSQIISLSHYSKDKSTSVFANMAQNYPSNFGEPEEIIKYRPDIILTSNYERDGTQNTIKLLNITTSSFGVPMNLNEAKEQIIRAGQLLNQSPKAQNLIQEIDIAARPSNQKPLRALVYFSGGNSAGKNTLLDELMTNAGLLNIAPEYGIANWGKIDLEKLVKNPPQILIIADKNTNGAFAERALRHPILKSKTLKMKIANFPNQYAYCGGAVIPKLAKHLKQIRNDYEFEQK